MHSIQQTALQAGQTAHSNACELADLMWDKLGAQMLMRAVQPATSATKTSFVQLMRQPDMRSLAEQIITALCAKVCSFLQYLVLMTKAACH